MTSWSWTAAASPALVRLAGLRMRTCLRGPRTARLGRIRGRSHRGRGAGVAPTGSRRSGRCSHRLRAITAHPRLPRKSLFRAQAANRSPSAPVLTQLRDDEADALGHVRLIRGTTFAWSWQDDHTLDRPLSYGSLFAQIGAPHHPVALDSHQTERMTLAGTRFRLGSAQLTATGWRARL